MYDKKEASGFAPDASLLYIDFAFRAEIAVVRDGRRFLPFVLWYSIIKHGGDS